MYNLYIRLVRLTEKVQQLYNRNKFNYPIYKIFVIMIPITTGYNVISETSLYLSPKNVSMSFNSKIYIFSSATDLLTFF